MAALAFSVSPLPSSCPSIHINRVGAEYKHLHVHSIVFSLRPCYTNFYAPYFSYSFTPHEYPLLFIKYSHILGLFLAPLVYFTGLLVRLLSSFPANIMVTRCSNGPQGIFPAQQHQHHLGTCYKYRLLGSTPDLLSQKL